MIDFHTHILPKIDDGSSSFRESLHMLREEARQGVSELVLTPHFYAKENSPASFLEKRNQVYEDLLESWNPKMPTMHLGAEVQYFEGICRAEDIELLKIQDTDLLLIEMPFCAWSGRMMEDVFELNSRPGIQIVLAHIERYLHRQHRNVLPELLDQGLLIQSNTSFFIDWKTKRRAMSMLENGEIHVLGSDCHNMKNRAPKWEKLPKKAFSEAEKSAKLIADRFFPST